MRKQSKGQFLKRPLRFMVRFNAVEMREFKSRARKAGLSQAEFGRRKILDKPVPDMTAPNDVVAPAVVGV
jgi:hypothetical protein